MQQLANNLVRIEKPSYSSFNEFRQYLLEVYSNVRFANHALEIDSAKVFGVLEEIALLDEKNNEQLPLINFANRIKKQYIDSLQHMKRYDPDNKKQYEEWKNVFFGVQKYFPNKESGILDKLHDSTNDIRRANDKLSTLLYPIEVDLARK